MRKKPELEKNAPRGIHLYAKTEADKKPAKKGKK